MFNIVLFALHSDWYKKPIKILGVSTEIGWVVQAVKFPKAVRRKRGGDEGSRDDLLE